MLYFPIYKRDDKGVALAHCSEEEMASVVSSDPRSFQMLRPCQPCSHASPGRLSLKGSGQRSVRCTDLGTCQGTGESVKVGLWERRGDLLLVGVVFLLN